MIATAPLPPIVLVLASVVILAASAAAPPPGPPQPPSPPPSSCTEELVLFSPCLPYISSPPNNLSATPSEGCCHAFSSALNSSNNGVCLCYLVQQPSILGFPVNGTRVLSLSSVCTLPRDGSSTKKGSLGSLCSGSPALPPLRSPASSGLTHPSGSGI
ncbi:hypothetical protein FH972_008473 [Carpinus fangiana]|uniref:Bifunctional inhibitor/plant lipid transfer protein/seed storage helical domain-containing protein n=1 Tax=Carpinus fangiana TaxID=176857 RepID=A0A5N6R151_9ROSI|nr:hypothetical protein FH972_008473 [Carpinus fangiana]